jgi:putative IMPACT (imprinted ancient) family translation regulator
MQFSELDYDFMPLISANYANCNADLLSKNYDSDKHKIEVSSKSKDVVSTNRVSDIYLKHIFCFFPWRVGF